MKNKSLYILFLSLALLTSQIGWAQLPDWLAPSSQRQKTEKNGNVPRRPKPSDDDSKDTKDANKAPKDTKASNTTPSEPAPQSQVTPAQGEADVSMQAEAMPMDSAIRGTMQFAETQTARHAANTIARIVRIRFRGVSADLLDCHALRDK